MIHLLFKFPCPTGLDRSSNDRNMSSYIPFHRIHFNCWLQRQANWICKINKLSTKENLI